MAQANPDRKWNDGLLTAFEQHVCRKGIRKRKANQKFHKLRKAMREEDPNNHGPVLIGLCSAMKLVVEAREEMRQAEQEYNDAVGDNTQMFGGWGDRATRMIQSTVRYRNRLRALIRIERQIGSFPADLLKHDREKRLLLLEKGLAKDRQSHAETQEEESNNRKARRNRFHRAAFEADPLHRFLRIDGGNDQSKLGLWVELDDYQNIKNRTVIKDVSYEEEADRKDWTKSTFWLNPWARTAKMPTEVQVMQRFSRMPSSNIVQLRKWHLFAERFMYRVSHIHIRKRQRDTVLTCKLRCTWNGVLTAMPKRYTRSTRNTTCTYPSLSSGTSLNRWSLPAS